MKNIEYDFTRQRLLPGFDGKVCKNCPAVATNGETVILSYGILLLTGVDMTVGGYMMKSLDRGKTFCEPVKQTNIPDTYENGYRHGYSAFPHYNKKHNKWLGIGFIHTYENDKYALCKNGNYFVTPFVCDIDIENCQYVNPRVIDFPYDYTYALCMGQIYELPNGDILAPFQYQSPNDPKFKVVVVRYTFSDGTLKIADFGGVLHYPEGSRGICEPSIARLGDKFYLTLRSDEVGLFAVSNDGLNFSSPKPYIWDDGSILENYNTQQHWMILKDGLFLAYTRKDAHNGHVFRHRAPIFMTRFDEDRECLIKSEEIILVPELGARLGNFCAVAPSDKEAWLVTAEWMQSWGEKLGVCETYGSDNSIWFIKMHQKQL